MGHELAVGGKATDCQPMWVTVWVRQLTRILTHTIFSVFATKKHRKPKFSMLFGAGGVTRTHDLLIYEVYRGAPFDGFQGFWSLSARYIVGGTSYPLHCFCPLISPCGSRCGLGRQLCVKEAADRLRRHISFCHFSLIIDSGNLFNESLLFLTGFRPRHAEFSAHRKKEAIS